MGLSRVFLFLLYFVMVAVQESESTGTFEWTLLRFENPDGKLDDGSSCDWLSDCDHKFTFGLDDLNGNYDAGNTPLLTEQTGVFDNEDTNTFTTGTNNNGVYNPIFYHFNRWQGGLLLKVYVIDYDDLSKNDYVDSIVYKLLVTPSASILSSTLISTVMNSRTRLYFTYRVYCDNHYYGNDCSTYCLGHDDNIYGHYSCDATGNKVCLSGWENEANNCKDRQNDCERNDCLNEALCIDGVRSYTCQCRPGFTGKFCETNIDECLSHPCKNDGTCIDGINDYTCKCDPSYVGKDCSKTVCPKLFRIACKESPKSEQACVVLSPCKNGGTCYGSGKCLCPPTFLGDSCDIPLCNKTGCLNGGACSIDGNCACPIGINGSMCDVVLCNAIAGYCMNGGICKNGNCVCPNGFAGLTCNENIVCKYTKCLNDGQCRPTINNSSNTYEPKCFCPAGISGDFCQNIPNVSSLEKSNQPNSSLSWTRQYETKKYSPLEILLIFFIITTILLLIALIVLIVLLCRHRKHNSGKFKAKKTVTSVSSDFSTTSEVFSEFGKSTVDGNFSNSAPALSFFPESKAMTSSVPLNVYQDDDDVKKDNNKLFEDTIYSKLNEGEIDAIKHPKDDSYEIIIPGEHGKNSEG